MNEREHWQKRVSLISNDWSKLHEFRQLFAFKLRKNLSNFTTSDGSNDAEEMLHSGLQIQLFLKKNGEAAARENTSLLFPKGHRRTWKMEKRVPFSSIKMSADAVICELHWPEYYAKDPEHWKPRPKHPPTVWPGVLSSRIPRPTPLPRTTSRVSLVRGNT